MGVDVLRDYIAYVNANFRPLLPDSTSWRILSAYLDMRRVGSGKIR